MKKRNKKKQNLPFMIIGIISLVITIIFCITLYMLNMLPNSYLITIYVSIFIILGILMFFTMFKKIKKKIKIVCTVILIIFDIIFGFGIYYMAETINFFGIIDNELTQKEEYYVMTLANNGIDEINDLKDSDIGAYSSLNIDKAIEELKNDLEFNDIKYSDVTEMFDDLEEKKLDAVIINGSIKNLLETDLEDLNNDLKEIHNFSIAIEQKDDIVKIADVTNETFNIYVAGGDAYGSIGNVTNTDVNMVITVDPVNKKILLTSIPRDYYVNLPSFGEDAYDKLTHVGYYGIEESVQAVEKLLDIDINYYVKINFSTIENVVDSIGGVDIYVDKGFTASDRTFTYTTGWNHMNGKKALRYARERKAFADGDVQRVKNQQKVLEAIIDKATSSTTIITNFTDILNSVSSSFSTNLDPKSIQKLVQMQLGDMSGWTIENQNLVGTDYYARGYSIPTIELYVMKKDDESVKTSSEKIKEYFNN